MVVVRNRITAIRAGGPRQFSELRDRLTVSIDPEQSFEAIKKIRNLGFTEKRLGEGDILLIEPKDTIAEVMSIAEGTSDTAREAIESVQDGEGVVDATDEVVETTSSIMDAILDISGVVNASFVRTYADYGPENLRFSPTSLGTIPKDMYAEVDSTLSDLHDKYNMEGAWEINRGENAIVAIFDTGYAEGLISEDRIYDTFHGDDVDSVYAPAEGHGTMCAGAAVADKKHVPELPPSANKELSSDVPFNGTAPGADVILVRITDSEGQIRGDYVTEAWNWIENVGDGRPIISNHSYGTPLCSGRPKARFCDTVENDLIKRVASDPYHTPVYAAGNEADTCGRRPSGLTNAITGTNSLAEVITVGALQFDYNDAQRYSSHGRGDCAPVADPKPNVSYRLPHKTYYGTEDGVTIKDMSTGLVGSAGGTSHASPSVAGIVALMQSQAMERYGEPLSTEEVKQILKEVSEPPRRTQINALPGPTSPDGWDARFGYGEPDPVKALEEV